MTACWPSPGQNPDKTSYNPTEATITRANVSQLAESWVAPVDSLDSPVTTPVLSTGRAHVVNGRHAYGIDARTGARLWKVSALADPPYPEIAWPGRDLFVEGGELLVSSGWSFARNSQYTTVRLSPTTGEHLGETPSGEVDSVRGTNTAGIATTLLDDTTAEQRLVVTGPGGGTALLSIRWGTMRTTLGADAVYVTGDGLVGPDRSSEFPGASPGSIWDHFGLGVRAFPLAPHQGCTTPEGIAFPWVFACPTWVATLDGTLASAPVLDPAGDRLYVTTEGGHAYALDRADGTVLWSADLGAAGDQPALAGDTLYAGTAGGTLAFDAAGCGAATCTPLWTASVGGDPTVAGDVLYTSDGTSIHAYAAGGCGAATCDPLWSADTGGDPGPVVVSGGRLFVGVDGRGLVSYARPPGGANS
jgi:outer membrane protein assembly factor BamB